MLMFLKNKEKQSSYNYHTSCLQFCIRNTESSQYNGEGRVVGVNFRGPDSDKGPGKMLLTPRNFNQDALGACFY